MVKLASSSEFRESAKRVGEELQKAEVDVQSKVSDITCSSAIALTPVAGTHAGDDGAHEGEERHT